MFVGRCTLQNTYMHTVSLKVGSPLGQPLWAMHVGVTVIQCWIVGGYCSVQGLRWLSYSGVCVGMYRVWVTHEYSDSGAEVGQICCQQLVKTSP